MALLSNSIYANNLRSILSTFLSLTAAYQIHYTLYQLSLQSKSQFHPYHYLHCHSSSSHLQFFLVLLPSYTFLHMQPVIQYFLAYLFNLISCIIFSLLTIISLLAFSFRKCIIPSNVFASSLSSGYHANPFLSLSSLLIIIFILQVTA